MALVAGAKLGPYEILSPLGAGGMGEVYRARDNKLGRDVALKVLPGEMAGDQQRMARFKREAQVLASLNHSNIAAIYGFEESGSVHALVMELVQGQTLAERLAGVGLVPAQARPQGSPLPIDEALPLAKQIAEALEYAHDHGIIHRDLKPANIKITPEGIVKVLDFGLAKALDVDPSSVSAASSPTFSPTLSIAATQAGMILGTAAYMSPEQAKGKSVDRRADIWAFGCVLYEILTGTQTFTGETVTDVLAGVVRAEPDWNLLPATVPARVRELIRRCLIKDPKHRLQAIGEARITIEETMAGSPSPPAPLPQGEGGPQGQVRVSPLQRALPWAIAGALLIFVIALSAALFLRKPGSPPSISASIGLPARATAPPLGFFAISPDGRRLAFVAAPEGGKTQLWVRPLDSLGAQPLAGTEGAIYPFWSPDSRYIGYFADGKLKKIEASGGPAQALCDAPEGRGGTWSVRGVIAFAPGVFTGISRVAETGGTPAAMTSTPEAGDSDRFPHFMPDGKHVLYLSLTGSGKKNHLRVVSLDSPEVKTIGEMDSDAIYDASGYLLYERDGNLVAQHFDTGNFTLSGDAVPIVERVEYSVDRGNASFSVSANGMLIYQGGEERAKSQLTWFDRDGNRLSTLGEPAEVSGPLLSPDGKRVLTSISGNSGKYSLWMFDVAHGISSRFTFGDTNDGWPVWSPDSKQVAYSMTLAGRLEIYLKPASGVENQKPLVTGEGESMATDWSRDGRFIAYQMQSRSTKKFDIWILPMTGDRKPFPFIATEADEGWGMFSPDGRWIAYASDESGHYEVYVVPFPGREGKWQISDSGGMFPVWVGNGSELDYFTNDRKWIAVEVNGKGSDFAIGASKMLFGGKALPVAPQVGLTITADGKKVLIPVPGERASVPFTVITDWRAQLKK
ncbi:MAG TPA: protein kinase [Terriglobia bacterium]|nr:protein kinase [Terriglobia bacterium]